MKYRLKKDLPFAKAGTKIGTILSEGCIPMAIFENQIDISLEYIDRLISDGWIEEVKPREWYLIPNSLPMFEPYAVVKTVDGTKDYLNVIKVREVIE